MSAQPPQSTQRTASLAVKLLVESNPEYRAVDKVSRGNLAAAFARKGSVIYGRAFDAVRVAGPADLDLTSEKERLRPGALDRITLIEVKSTNRTSLPESFAGYFFALTTADCS
jgi:hypothetical protein